MAECQYSGLTVRSCKASDLCDCFDYPEPPDRLVTETPQPEED